MSERPRFGYPVSLDLAGHRAVVIGADAVAQGKVEGLLAAGARVAVVADGPTATLAALESDPRVTVARRPWRPGDLDGATVCVAASGDPGTRAAICREARGRGVLVNVMDDVEHCDFAAPALVRRGDLLIAISTGGRSPALARRLREELEARFGDEWAVVLDLLAEVRADTLDHLPDLQERARRWQDALDLDELVLLVRGGRYAEARRTLTARLLAGEPNAATVGGPPGGARPAG
ncbi:MAG TPA: bifunctional precorrin-2 dehydrogenase/sirohydrochlorin ferrochelatase [Actinomycetes bacterium]